MNNYLKAINESLDKKFERFLSEGYNEEHMTRVIPTVGDPKINSAIIDSVIGQISDGI